MLLTVLQYIVTTRVLKLLHMDLIGPTQAESWSRHRYIFVCVDDYSKFTQVDFLKEKSKVFGAFKKLCTHNFRMRRIVKSERLLESEVTIEESLKMLNLLTLVENMRFTMYFQHQKFLNRMKQLNVRITLFKKWAKLCLIRRNFP